MFQYAKEKLRVLLIPFSWRKSHDSGVWLYFENTVTGKRKALRCIEGGYQPVDYSWLEGKSSGFYKPKPPKIG